jgi:hypothetical protein
MYRLLGRTKWRRGLMPWDDGAQKKSDNTLDIIEAYRNQLRDAARVIRNCDCDQGYSRGTRGEREYPCVSECHCFTAYKSLHREMMEQVRKWEKATGNEYRNPLSTEMISFAHPTGERPSREAMQLAKQAMSRVELGITGEEQ